MAELDMTKPFPVLEMTKIDDKDQGTPDDWVPRHPDLVRLTGRHPFNVEPPLPALMEQGFLTPASLHYVRNHGAVPRCEWATHKLHVQGHCTKPTTFSMDDILKLPARELPVTLVCAGNRRKEENLVKQTIGFNWGAAGVSTSVWKGVRLCDVMKAVGMKTPADGAKHVCFVGTASENMPKGRYGTSIPWYVATDPAQDVLLAYEQNGERLTPDHGYPLRLVIPGYIGGRMIKWLTDIEITEKESDNHFHFMDNRVLPEHVDAEKATAEGWWYKPDFIINELNINSAMATPGHLEVVPLGKKGQKYKITGYCYSGGGRKVIRVEVSLDGGKTWTLTEIVKRETPTEYGKYWCWCFFEHTIDLMDLYTADAPMLMCRGWDAHMNRQPEDIVWNVMGMMNNSWFRIHVHRTLTDDGKPALKFQHPTLAGPGNFGGWFEEKSLGKADAAAVAAVEKKANAASAPKRDGEREYSLAEVAKHDTQEDCWIVVKGVVYDATKFLDDHPGGGSSIVLTAGTDCTEEFEALHSSKAWAQLEDHRIGIVAGEDAPTGAAAPAAPPVDPHPPTLSPKKWVSLPLVEREELSHDTRRFRFGLPSAAHRIGLPIGQHIFLKASIGGQLTMRAYTPTSSDDHHGYVEFVIKVYFRNVHPRFPDGGKLTQHMEAMKIGETLDFKGPLGEYIFNADVPQSARGSSLATFTHVKGGEKQTYHTLGFIAGGSGITPCLQVATKLLKDKENKVSIKLLYANQTEDDILCRPQLEELASDPRFEVWYTIDRATEGWKYSTGFINEEMVAARLPAYEKQANIFICGPPPMIKFACLPNLEKVGYPPENIHCF